MIAEKLKKSIIESAVLGKLTEQISYDGDSKVLLQILMSSKEANIQRKLIKSEQVINDKTEIDLDVPPNWLWVKLGNLVSVYGGKRLPVGKRLCESDTGQKYITVSDMKNGSVDTSHIKYVPRDIQEQIKDYTINKEDIYITVAGTIGRIGEIPESLDGANLTENSDKLVFDLLEKRWLIYVLQSNVVQQQISASTTKVGQPKLAIKRIRTLDIPLPPLAEQKRIVEKLDQILPMIDALENYEVKLQDIMVKFPDNMKASLLQAAIQGKLTEQLTSDGNAQDLFDAIISKTFIKDTKVLPITTDDVLFDIPDNWKWVRFGNIASYSMGKTPPRSESKYWSQNEHPWVSIADMIEDGVVKNTKEFVSNVASEEIFKGRISCKGTLLMSFKLTVGRVSKLDIDAYHNEAIISIYPYDDTGIMREYLYKILPFISNFGNTKTAIKGKTLNSQSISNLLVPMPPLAEQKRIVDKLDRILPLIDDLKYSL